MTNLTITQGIKRVLALSLVTACLLISACGSSGGSSSSSSSGGNGSSSGNGSGGGSDEMTMLRADGTQWVKADGTPILLRGTNLGNWLLQEFWMMGQSTAAVNDQCTLESVLDDRFGFEERERLMRMFRDNWITERDWDLLVDFGMNVVRIPFIWNLIEDEHNPFTLRDDAWHYLDYALDEAEARDIYVILDLHGAVGSQGWEHHSGCSDLNLYWDTPEYQERTIWLWQQIAERYRDRVVVAGYGLLNEPWGTSPENLADVMETLYHAVREVDQEHIIILPGHYSGIHAYGNPADRGMTNVAMEMHFYPGIFGWGEIGYEVHRDWLLCGSAGTTGVCEWDQRLRAIDTPFLIGEFQPWTGLGLELGAQITRATYDIYGQYGWAATNWAYKVLTNTGGQGGGTWGMVTNQRDLGVLTKANTWVCPGWDSSLEDACDAATETLVVPGEGEQLYYLVIKAGSLVGELDITFDQISLVNDTTQEEVVINGGFGSSDGWTSWYAAGEPVIDFGYEGAQGLPSGAAAPVLRVSAADGETGFINGGIYQAVTLEGGQSYSLSGFFKDNGSADAWGELFLVPDEPQPGVDVTGDALPQLDFPNAPLEEIEALFQAFGTLEYDVHEELMYWMTSSESPDIFNPPARPTGLTLTISASGAELVWNANTEANLDGYNVYRSTTPGANYSLLAEGISDPFYTDTSFSDDVTYYYVVTAFSGIDESHYSDEVASAIVRAAIPGTIQAENYSAMSGIDTEPTTDTGGGYNVGWLDPGDWFEYEVDIQQAGTYTVEYRVASQGGSSGFQLSVNGSVIDTQGVPNTGGWQNWVTLSATVTLPAGEHTLRFDALGGSWNLNWIRFTEDF